MSAINLPAGQPSDPSACERIGREVFLSTDTCVRDSGRSAIGEYFCERSGILVTDDAGDGPGCGRMGRGKGIATLPEFALKRIDAGTLAARSVAERGCDK